jgi:hypothetical protein
MGNYITAHYDPASKLEHIRYVGDRGAANTSEYTYDRAANKWNPGNTVVFQTGSTIISVGDVYSTLDGNTNSGVLTTARQVDLASYISANQPSEAIVAYPVQDPYGTGPEVADSPFLDMAVVADSKRSTVHAITLMKIARSQGAGIVDWFGTDFSIPPPSGEGDWTVIPLLLSFVPDGKKIAASYSEARDEIGILVASDHEIELIRYTPGGSASVPESFASFPQETIVSITSFSVPDEAAQHVAAVTTGGAGYNLWDMSYQVGITSPYLVYSAFNFQPIEISGYSTPDALRHIAIMSSDIPFKLYEGSYDQNDQGFSPGNPWPTS